MHVVTPMHCTHREFLVMKDSPFLNISPLSSKSIDATTAAAASSSDSSPCSDSNPCSDSSPCSESDTFFANALNLNVTTTTIPPHAECIVKRDVFYKMENEQITGSFKYRGIFHHISAMKQKRGVNTLVASSAGNAGLAATHAAHMLDMAAILVVPQSTPEIVLSKLRHHSASRPASLFYLPFGRFWREADTLVQWIMKQPGDLPLNITDIDREIKLVLGTDAYQVLAPDIENALFKLPEIWNTLRAATHNLHLGYTSPFDHPEIWEGHASIVDEIKNDFDRKVAQEGYLYDRPAAIILSMGGGGLCLGVLEGLKRHGWDKDVVVYGVETEGAASFAQSFYAKELILLSQVRTIAATLGVPKVAAPLLDYIIDNGATKTKLVPIVVTDKLAVRGLLQLKNEFNVLVEPSCGCNIAALDFIHESSQESTPSTPTTPLTPSSPYKVHAKSFAERYPNASALSSEPSVPVVHKAPIIVICCGGSLVNEELIQTWTAMFLDEDPPVS